MNLAISLVWTVCLLVLMVLACTVFTNGIEWVGFRFKLSKGAVGSVLAAVGTALPETLVPIAAIIAAIFPGMGIAVKNSHEIAIGAILGAPFLLSTLAMAVSGFAWWYFHFTRRRATKLHIDESLFHRDLHYFFIAFSIAILAAFFRNHAFREIVAALLLSFYGVYVYRTLKKEHVEDEEFEMEPLLLAPKIKSPPTWVILFQTLFGLGAISLAAQLFVKQINGLSSILHWNALVLSLIIAPIATELPEKFNSVVWIGKEKDTLALGNITGAMVFQSCLPTSIGLLFTEWQFTQQALLSVMLCLVSTLVVYIFVRTKKSSTVPALLTGGLFYLAFLIYSIILIQNGS